MSTYSHPAQTDSGRGSGSGPRRQRNWLPWSLSLLSLAAFALALWWYRQAQSHTRQSQLEHQFWVVGQAASTPRERTAAFWELIAAGNREWRGAHLQGLDLTGAKLTGKDLSAADFKDAVFAGADLADAKIVKATLEQADLTGANLTGADLSGSFLLRVKLQQAQLTRANLRGASLEQAEAQNATFLMANLADALLLMANLGNAKLGGADLTGANLEAAILKGADLSLARLNDANLKDTDFSRCNWWRARGLSALQLTWLEQKFRPNAEWPADLREDFEEWSRRRAGEHEIGGAGNGGR